MVASNINKKTPAQLAAADEPRLDTLQLYLIAKAAEQRL